MKTYGVIYCLKFIKPGTPDYYYIGQTTRSLKLRIYDHINRAWKINNEGNFENNYRLPREIRKYGIKDKVKDVIWSEKYSDSSQPLLSKNYITVAILDTAKNQEELNQKEKYYIIKYNSYEHFEGSRGFNGTLGGYGNSEGVLRGELSHVAQLTNYQARQVRLLNRDTSLTYIELADLFGCSLGCIHGIIYGLTYQDVKITEGDKLDAAYQHWIAYAPISRKTDKYFYSYDLRKSNSEERIQMWESAVECANNLSEGLTAQYIYYALAGKKGIVADHFAFVRVNERYEFERTKLPLLEARHKKRFRPFNAYEKATGKYVATFQSIGDCLNKFNLKNNSPIYKCLRHQSSHSGDYIYIYNDEFSLELLQKKMEIANKRPFYMFDIQGTIIGDQWLVIKECAKIFKIHESNIIRCLKNKTIYKEKYIFIYVDEFNQEELDGMIKSVKDKKNERYLLFDLEGKRLGESSSQYDLYHNKGIHTAGYALRTEKYFIPSLGLIIIPESKFSYQKLNSIIEEAKTENNKFQQSKNESKKEILIYSKDSFIAKLPTARAALQTDIIPIHAAYRVPRRENKIYKKKYIIIFPEDAKPSVLMELREKLP